MADPLAEAKSAHEAALKKYETDSDVYRIRKKEYDEKKTSGEKQAKRLNARFADWYYVISEELFTELRVKPEDLTEPLVAAPPVGVEEGLPEIQPLPNVPKTETPAAEGQEPVEPKDGDKPAPPAEPANPGEGDKPTEGDKPAVPEGEKPAAKGDPAAAETPPPAVPEKPSTPADAPAAE